MNLDPIPEEKIYIYAIFRPHFYKIKQISSNLTLSINFGYKNIDIALVQTYDGTSNPLFAGTFLYGPRQLSRTVLDHDPG
jgi:hypothetical protein